VYAFVDIDWRNGRHGSPGTGEREPGASGSCRALDQARNEMTPSGMPPQDVQDIVALM
jgi:hypothetical protein